ncbi:type IV pilus twitching motility protein PilT [Cyanobium sp. ATX 6F1]|uniref:type IV pilus twitching motility protein PilT n=1 Tax=Cyanobium sp. ATX 6F1 TaxID=2823702 RepID=UPI0020CCF02C|nr:type IV pilus twitching motility protein PilT [Cyanobium sp. ATX 6F1]MCP9915025.1 type IV pilus twitching motility protein PilT [Cyanobium sp. ATX 6F1]
MSANEPGAPSSLFPPLAAPTVPDLPPIPSIPAIPSPAAPLPEAVSTQAITSSEEASKGLDLPPEPSNLQEIVRIAHERNFSDVHLGVGEEPRYRVRGDMRHTGWPVADQATFNGWLREMLTPVEIDRFQNDKEFDGSFAFPFVRVRINLLETLLGPAMVLRLIPQKIATIQDLNLPDVLEEVCQRPKGLVLVTGPTGSGKSTTLAAMIDWINRNQKRHIVTIEDPIEFVHQSKSSMVRQREVGHHTKLFHNALRAVLREDPDVILIGEIRDRETLTTALEASQTGHLVFGTLHTNSAVRTVERVLGMYPPEDQDNVRRSVSEALLAVISQGLIKTTDGKRAAFHDILINTDACRDYIQQAKMDEVEQIMERSAFDGMQSANQALLKLVQTGKVDPEDALAQSLKPNELAQSLRGRQ